MNVLCVGDIVGRSGAQMLAGNLKYIKRDYDIDFVIANGENANTGNGINRSRADFLLDCGVDVITLGNHAFSKREVFTLFNENYPIVRPYNLPKKTPGTGYVIKRVGDKTVAVISLMGRVFMNPCDCPFNTVDELLEKIDADLIFVDFHAEATSEKKAMGWYLAGRATCVFGTHTHVQTADEEILKSHTAYISDVGMTGPYNSVLGVKKEVAVRRFVTSMHERYEIADGNCQINAIAVAVGDDGKAKKIERINLR